MNIIQRKKRLKNEGFKITSISEHRGETVLVAVRKYFKMVEEKVFRFNDKGEEI